MWSIRDAAREAIGRSLEERFTFLMRQLNIANTERTVARHIEPVYSPISREAEILAAGGMITAAEKKAEGLAD